MMRALRLVAAVLIIAGAIVLAAYEIYELVRTGTCGAPAGAVAARACPEGTGLRIVLLILAIFVLPFVGLALAPDRRVALGGSWWIFLWIAMGGAAIVAGYGPAAPESAEEGSLGVGITFLAIGLLSLLGAAWTGMSARGRATVPTPSASRLPDAAPPPPDPELAELDRLVQQAAAERVAPSGDAAVRPIAERLAKLDELRDAGLITDAERAARRREILDEI